jgi:hypothetical protein
MADHIETSLEPRKGAAARITGDPMTPENAKARLSPAGRTGAIRGAPLVPENTTARKSGNAMDNSMKSNVVAPVITRATPKDPGVAGIPK